MLMDITWVEMKVFFFLFFFQIENQYLHVDMHDISRMADSD